MAKGKYKIYTFKVQGSDESERISFRETCIKDAEAALLKAITVRGYGTVEWKRVRNNVRRSVQ